jgi:hypothetical protein
MDAKSKKILELTKTFCAEVDKLEGQVEWQLAHATKPEHVETAVQLRQQLGQLAVSFGMDCHLVHKGK